MCICPCFSVRNPSVKVKEKEKKLYQENEEKRERRIRGGAQ